VSREWKARLLSGKERITPMIKDGTLGGLSNLRSMRIPTEGREGVGWRVLRGQFRKELPLEGFNVTYLIFEAVIKGNAAYLLLRVVIQGQEGVPQSLLHCDSVFGPPGQHPVNQIKSYRSREVAR